MDKPVAISRLKAIQRYFSANALAFFEPTDPSSLAKEMVNLYRNKDLRDRMATNARQEYAPIRWEVMKQRYLITVQQIVTGNSLVKQTADGEVILPTESPKSSASH